MLSDCRKMLPSNIKIKAKQDKHQKLSAHLTTIDTETVCQDSQLSKATSCIQASWHQLTSHRQFPHMQRHLHTCCFWNPSDKKNEGGEVQLPHDVHTCPATNTFSLVAFTQRPHSDNRVSYHHSVQVERGSPHCYISLWQWQIPPFRVRCIKGNKLFWWRATCVNYQHQMKKKNRTETEQN